LGAALLGHVLSSQRDASNAPARSQSSRRNDPDPDRRRSRWNLPHAKPWTPCHSVVFALTHSRSGV
jgi:hypothetical protein